MFNGENKSLGCFHDLFSARLVYNLVKKEVCKNASIDRYIFNKYGKYCIRKKINGKDNYFGTFASLEEVRAERDLLVKFNWDLEKACECVDGTVNGKIIINNKVVGMVEV